MRPLPKPDLKDASGNSLTPRDVFELCISRVRKKKLKARFKSIAPLIESAAAEYDTAANAGTLHTIQREAVVGRKVTNKQLVGVYTNSMVPATSPGRPIYNAIFSATRRCPLCGGVGEVKSLDHHLPKGEYSRLTVTPSNLVPACKWCQEEKMVGYPATVEEQTMHPYFDDFDSVQWLKATVRQTSPATFEFFVGQPPGWDATKIARARYHLKTFKLGTLFSSNAAEELTNIRHRLAGLFATGDATSVQAHLAEEAGSRRAAYLNAWRTAMYEAAAADAWFCAGGFAGT